MVSPARFCGIVLLVFLSISAAAQEIDVRASIDRSSVRENESFTYSLRIEGDVRGEPNVSAIQDDFDVLNQSTSTSIRIINGQTEQIAEWQYQLMPRRAGRLRLPPVNIGGVESNSLELEVLPAPPPGDDVSDIFMEVVATPERAYVQSQVVFTLRLYVGIGTGRATLTAPELNGVEAIMERLGEDAQYQTMRDGRNFLVRERRYAVFPQATGSLQIGPVTFEAMVMPNRGFSRMQRFRSETATVEVLPAVAPPPEFPNAVWLPASRVEIRERWNEAATSAGIDAFEMGIPRTRTLTIEADGLLETQLPDVEIQPADGVRQYADQPELERSAGPAGLTVQRTERFAVIAQRPGSVELPSIELPWWNVDSEQWEVASLPARTLAVAPGADLVVQDLVPGEGEAAIAVAPVSPNYWRYAAMLLAIGWLITAALWWRSANRTRPESTAIRPRKRTTLRQSRAVPAALLSACDSNDTASAQRLLLEWAQARLPDETPLSLGALAQRLPNAAAQAILELETYLYGRESKAWDGRALGIALRSLQRADKKTTRGKGKDPLPPLYR